MILVTRLNHHHFYVNADLIKLIEQSPDTVITLLNGDKVIALESAEEIIGRVIDYRRRMLDGLALLHTCCRCNSPQAHQPAETA